MISRRRPGVAAGSPFGQASGFLGLVPADRHTVRMIVRTGTRCAEMRP